jgi:hypothetical protein
MNRQGYRQEMFASALELCDSSRISHIRCAMPPLSGRQRPSLSGHQIKQCMRGLEIGTHRIHPTGEIVEALFGQLDPLRSRGLAAGWASLARQLPRLAWNSTWSFFHVACRQHRALSGRSSASVQRTSLSASLETALLLTQQLSG